MKKTLFFIFAVMLLSACQKSNQDLAEQLLRDEALVPSSIKILKFNEDPIPAKLECDTFYHIATMDGYEDMLSKGEWFGITTICTDSIRIEEWHYPAVTYCSVRFEAANVAGVPIAHDDYVVIVDGKAVMGDDYISRDYAKCNRTILAQNDTLTNVRYHITIHPEDDMWVFYPTTKPYRK